MKRNDYHLAKRIRGELATFGQYSDAVLRERSVSLKFSLPAGCDSRTLAHRAFPIIIEAIRRKTGKTAHNVQIYAAERMLGGYICEMKTGEGKTMTALLALYALSLRQEGVHLATANDYLAARDAEYAASIFRTLGISVGSITGNVSPAERPAQYRKYITYGTAKEFGFDFLRDELNRRRGNERTIPTQNNLLLDEADSLLIDEASTPLIIGMKDDRAEEQRFGLAHWANEHADSFQESLDYEFDDRRFSFLTRGILRLRELPGNQHTKNVSLQTLVEYVENAIKAKRNFNRDVQYRVVDDGVAILDEFTGRIAEGRQWQRGLHQAIEAKENLEISPRTETAATVTIQTLVNRYRFATGMTGTAWDSRNEFKKVYRLPVIRIPTHRPVNRVQKESQIYRTQKEKFVAVAELATELHQQGKSTLIGTRTLEQSEQLSELFYLRKLPHQVLNASREEHEARIVADAGQPGRVTIATNMAGRGTDIPLHSDVKERGGLNVILTELHESRRIDWQLIGRGARQGDPGSYQMFLSLEDEILEKGFGDKKHLRLQKKWAAHNRELPGSLVRLFYAAQRKVESTYFKSRMILLEQEKGRQDRFRETGENPFLYPPR